MPSGGRAQPRRIASAALLVTGTVLAILSVGIFLLPTAVLMLIAAALTSRHPSAGRRPDAGTADTWARFRPDR